MEDESNNPQAVDKESDQGSKLKKMQRTLALMDRNTTLVSKKK